MLGLSPAEITHYGPAGFRTQRAETAPTDIPDPHPDSGPLQIAGQ
jgi:hypothetical protein